MKKMTKEQISMIENQTKEILKDIAEDKNIREIQAQIYVDNLEDKTMRQGGVMADAILASIQSFDSDFSAAREDVNGYIDKFIEEVCRDKSCGERCNYLLKLCTAAGSAQSIWTAESEEQESKIKELMAEVENKEVSEDEATAELEAELYKKAKDALMGSDIMLSALIEQEDQLKELEDGDEAAALLLDLGAREVDFRAVMAMLVYVNVKNGTFDNLPSEMTASQAAALVCAQSEQMRILEAVERGHMAADAATVLLQILGVVVIARICIGAALSTFPVCMAVFGWFLAIPACLVAITGILHFMECAGNAWFEDSKQIVHMATVGAGVLRRGAVSVMGYAKDTIFPLLASAAGTLMEGIKNMLSRFKNKEDTDQESSRESVETENETEVFA